MNSHGTTRRGTLIKIVPGIEPWEHKP